MQPSSQHFGSHAARVDDGLPFLSSTVVLGGFPSSCSVLFCGLLNDTLAISPNQPLRSSTHHASLQSSIESLWLSWVVLFCINTDLYAFNHYSSSHRHLLRAYSLSHRDGDYSGKAHFRNLEFCLQDGRHWCPGALNHGFHFTKKNQTISKICFGVNYKTNLPFLNCQMDKGQKDCHGERENLMKLQIRATSNSATICEETLVTTVLNIISFSQTIKTISKPVQSINKISRFILGLCSDLKILVLSFTWSLAEKQYCSESFGKACTVSYTGCPTGHISEAIPEESEP